MDYLFVGVRRSWRAGADCNSVVLSLNRFDSYHPTSSLSQEDIQAEVAQLVEHQPSKLNVAVRTSSSARSSRCSSVVERVLGKDEAEGSIPFIGSSHELENK